MRPPHLAECHCYNCHQQRPFIRRFCHCWPPGTVLAGGVSIQRHAVRRHPAGWWPSSGNLPGGNMRQAGFVRLAYRLHPESMRWCFAVSPDHHRTVPRISSGSAITALPQTPGQRGSSFSSSSAIFALRWCADDHAGVRRRSFNRLAASPCHESTPPRPPVSRHCRPTRNNQLRGDAGLFQLGIPDAFSSPFRRSQPAERQQYAPANKRPTAAGDATCAVAPGKQQA